MPFHDHQTFIIYNYNTIRKKKTYLHVFDFFFPTILQWQRQYTNDSLSLFEGSFCSYTKLIDPQGQHQHRKRDLLKCMGQVPCVEIDNVNTGIKKKTKKQSSPQPESQINEMTEDIQAEEIPQVGSFARCTIRNLLPETKLCSKQLF